MNEWATVVKRKGRNGKTLVVPKPSVKESFIVRSEKQLDQLLARHPLLAAIPDSDKKLRKVLRTMPDELVCEIDEVLCLVDST